MWITSLFELTEHSVIGYFWDMIPSFKYSFRTVQNYSKTHPSGHPSNTVIIFFLYKMITVLDIGGC